MNNISYPGMLILSLNEKMLSLITLLLSYFLGTNVIPQKFYNHLPKEN